MSDVSPGARTGQELRKKLNREFLVPSTSMAARQSLDCGLVTLTALTCTLETILCQHFHQKTLPYPPSSLRPRSQPGRGTNQAENKAAKGII